MLTEGPQRTRRSLAPNYLNSQWAEGTACYAGAFNLACHMCAETWPTAQASLCRRECPGGDGKAGSHLRRTGARRKRKRGGPEERHEVERRNGIGQRGISTTHVLNNKGLLDVFCTLDICSLNIMASGDSSSGSMGAFLHSN